MLTRATLKDLVKSKLGDTIFVIASNREPYIHTFKEGKVECILPASGMVTALDPIMQACGGIWVAHGSGNADKEVVDAQDKTQVPPNNPRYALRRIWLDKTEEDGYYYGLSNETLWPLCHTVYVRPKFNKADWEQYKKINERFAEAILSEIGEQKAFVWFQDFHLALAPKMVKDKNPNVTTAHFWHIPWPNTEAFRICPWKREILEGLLANDIIGFHVRYHCNNFLDTVDQTLEAKTDRDTYSVSYKGSITRVKPFPISIDFKSISDTANSPEVELEMLQIRQKFNLKDKIVAVSVERIDYTKGIPERLKAIDVLLEKYPEYRQKFVFLQLGAPSRTHIDAYERINKEIDSLVEEINLRYQADDWVPTVFWREHHGLRRILACYKLANICIVSPLHDGMNLVAKEFIAAQNDLGGMLVLSRFCGSSRELQDAILINPYDTEEFVEGIRDGIVIQAEERKRRMEKMREIVKENNIYAWAGNVISALKKIA
jgi:alpha,alpha-trehalose-phosphate synthase [UDP-forming]